MSRGRCAVSIDEAGATGTRMYTCAEQFSTRLKSRAINPIMTNGGQHPRCE